MNQPPSNPPDPLPHGNQHGYQTGHPASPPPGPNSPQPNAQMDAEHLKWLAIGHLVLIGVALLYLLYSMGSAAFALASIQRSQANYERMMEKIEREQQEQGSQRKNWRREVIGDRRSSDARINSQLTHINSMAMASMVASLIFRTFLTLFFAANLAFGAYTIHHRKSHLHLFISSVITCLLVPLGTVLGILTLIMIMRPAVKSTFAGPHFNHQF